MPATPEQIDAALDANHQALTDIVQATADPIDAAIDDNRKLLQRVVRAAKKPVNDAVKQNLALIGSVMQPAVDAVDSAIAENAGLLSTAIPDVAQTTGQSDITSADSSSDQAAIGALGSDARQRFTNPFAVQSTDTGTAQTTDSVGDLGHDFVPRLPPPDTTTPTDTAQQNGVEAYAFYADTGEVQQIIYFSDLDSPPPIVDTVQGAFVPLPSSDGRPICSITYNENGSPPPEGYDNLAYTTADQVLNGEYSGTAATMPQTVVVWFGPFSRWQSDYANVAHKLCQTLYGSDIPPPPPPPPPNGNGSGPPPPNGNGSAPVASCPACCPMPVDPQDEPLAWSFYDEKKHDWRKKAAAFTGFPDVSGMNGIDDLLAAVDSLPQQKPPQGDDIFVDDYVEPATRATIEFYRPLVP